MGTFVDCTTCYCWDAGFNVAITLKVSIGWEHCVNVTNYFFLETEPCMKSITVNKYARLTNHLQCKPWGKHTLKRLDVVKKDLPLRFKFFQTLCTLVQCCYEEHPGGIMESLNGQLFFLYCILLCSVPLWSQLSYLKFHRDFVANTFAHIPLTTKPSRVRMTLGKNERAFW